MATSVATPFACPGTAAVWNSRRMSQTVTKVRGGGAYALWTLILAACVANLNLSVANVALPDIGRSLGATQIELNMVAVGFTLGLASSVLYLGAIGDRYGRKRLLILGLALSIPASALAAWAPDPAILIAGRLLGGVCAGMVYPVTLSIITALFTGKQRVMAIALWSGIGAGASALGPAIVGWLITFAWWGAGFAMTIPLAAVALLLCLRLPSRMGVSATSVDHLGGILSVIMVATLIAAITFAPTPGQGLIAIGLAIVTIVSTVAFVLRERRATNPIFDLRIARRRIFWVAAIAGIIVFGSLMGALFIGQQYMQNVLGYDSLQAGLGIVPAAFTLIVFSPLAAPLIHRYGSRITLVMGFVIVAIGFIGMYLWKPGSSYVLVGTTYAVLAAGVAFAAAPASRAIMSSVPASNLGMGSATNDLQRDLGGAIMQSIMGTLLVVKYSSDITSAVQAATPQQQSELSASAITLMSQSFTGAQQVAQGLPGNGPTLLMNAAKSAFSDGSNVAYAFALLAVIVGLLLVAFLYPGKQKEAQILAEYASEEAAPPESTSPR